MSLKCAAVALVIAAALWLAGCTSNSGCGRGCCGGGGAPPPPPPASQTAVYYCPMHPQVTAPGPGNCSICGMALVPRR